MSDTVLVRNRQRNQPVNSKFFGKILRTLLVELLGAHSFDLALYIVAAPEMTRLNETYLRHQGSTDVLAFDYSNTKEPSSVRGEIFVCPDEAKIQAARYHTDWRSELVRYAVHGVLHLRGYDDQRRESRRKMKREEDRLLKELEKACDFSRI